MTTTSRLRYEYPELVIDWSPIRCRYATTVPVVLLAGGPYTAGRVTLRVHPSARQATRALAATLLAYRYSFDEPAGGTLSCRLITGGSLPSLHAHGIALDINPSRNPYRSSIVNRRYDLPWESIRAIESIQTASGQRVWAWGGHWVRGNDPMHFQLYCTRAAIATGINLATVRGWREYLAFESGQLGTGSGDDGVIPLSPGQVRPIVRELQAALNRVAAANAWANWVPLELDGRAGDNTLVAANRARHNAGLEPVAVGVVFDGPTMAYLLGEKYGD